MFGYPVSRPFVDMSGGRFSVPERKWAKELVVSAAEALGWVALPPEAEHELMFGYPSARPNPEGRQDPAPELSLSRLAGDAEGGQPRSSVLRGTALTISRLDPRVRQGRRHDFVTQARLRFSRPMPFPMGGDPAGVRDSLEFKVAKQTVEVVDWRAATALAGVTPSSDDAPNRH